MLAVEDTPAGISSAAANGLATLGVAQTFDAEELAAADQVVESLAEVSLPRIQALFE